MSGSSLFTEFVAGNVFGAALTTSGVFAPTVITAQMELQSFQMMKTMLAASATSALIIAGADHFGISKAKPKPASTLGLFSYDGNLIGGALLGLGMATTGACPGTSMVQMAIGMPSGNLVVLGGVIGGLLYPVLLPHLQRACQAGSKTSTVSKTAQSDDASATVHGSFNLSPITVLLGWELMCLTMLRLATAYDPATSKGLRFGVVDPIVGGVAVGLAQGVSIYLNKRTLGTSGLYRDLSQWITRAAQTFKKTGRFRFPPRQLILTPAVVFALGIMSAGFTLANTIFKNEYAQFTTTNDRLDTATAILSVAGGAMMVIGARMAGGCTSGHGISGMSTFSWSSFVTTAAMMAGGIQTARLLTHA